MSENETDGGQGQGGQPAPGAQPAGQAQGGAAAGPPQPPSPGVIREGIRYAQSQGKLPEWAGQTADKDTRRQLREELTGTHDIATAAEKLALEGSIVYDQADTQEIGNLAFNSGLPVQLEYQAVLNDELGESFYVQADNKLYTVRMDCYSFVHLAGYFAGDAQAKPRYGNFIRSGIDLSTLQEWDGSSEIPRGKVIVACIKGIPLAGDYVGEGADRTYHFGVSLGGGKVASNHNQGAAIESLQDVFGGGIRKERLAGNAYNVYYGDYPGFKADTVVDPGPAQDDPRWMVVINAGQVSQRQMGWSDQQRQDAVDALSSARWNLDQTWQRQKGLKSDLVLLPDDVTEAQNRVSVLEQTLGTATSNRAYHQQRLDQAKTDLVRLQDRRTYLEGRVEENKQELQYWHTQYESALAPLRQFTTGVNTLIDQDSIEVQDYFIKDNFPQYVPGYWDLGEMDQVRRELGLRVSLGPAPAEPGFFAAFFQNKRVAGPIVVTVTALALAGGAYAGGVFGGGDLDNSIVFPPPAPVAFETGTGLSSGGQGSAAGTAPAPAATAIPRPVLYGFEGLPALAMTAGERDAISGPGTFNATRTNVTDPTIAFASLPVVSSAINSAGGRLLYNADQATAQTAGGIFGRQNSTIWFPSDAAAASAVDVMVANYPTLFQDYVSLSTPVGWKGHCFTGRIVNTNAQGQTSQSFWGGCALQRQNVVLASYFGSMRAIEANSFLTNINAYHARAQSLLSPAATAPPPASAPAATAVPAPPPPAPIAGAVATAAPAPPTVAPAPAAAPNFATQVRGAIPDYVAAIRAANGAYVLAHLHQTATTFYGQAACQDFFGRLGADPTFNVEILSVRGPESWTWTIYGETPGTIADAYTVRVRLTQQGQTVEADAHFAWDAQRGLQVFSPCRRPPGA